MCVRCARGLKFKTQADQIWHSVANSTPLFQHLLSSYVTSMLCQKERNR